MVGPHGAVAKAVVILEVLARARAELSLSQIADRAGLAKATTHRIVSMLQTHGMVQRGARGYVLGDKPHAWASTDRSASSLELRLCARPYLDALRAVTRLAPSLAVLSGTSVVYLEGGGPEPVHRAAAGKVLLAFDPTAGERFPLDDLEHELRVIRDRGLASDDAGGLAVPVFDSTRRVSGAVGVSGAYTDNRNLVEAALRTQAANITVALRQKTSRPAGRPPGGPVSPP